VIGDLLPVALGVAISPVPIIAVILMLLAPHAKAASIAFLVGWVAGIAVVVGLVVLVMGPVDGSTSSDPPTWVSVLKLVLGAAVVLLGAKEWRSRPHGGEKATLPKWMSAIDSVTPVKAFGLGALLSAVNPKNLALCLSGGLLIGSAGLSGGDEVVAVAVFVVIGSSSVAVPVLGYLVAQRRLAHPLDELKEWLTVNNAAVMSVVLLVIGETIAGKGLAGRG
jgi:threonine/homoserine/homoserine lactone efflux protein